MPRRERITRELDLANSARIEGIPFLAKTANYNCVGNSDGGKVFNMTCANAAHTLYFNLPTVAAMKNKYVEIMKPLEGVLKISCIDQGTDGALVARGNEACNIVNYDYTTNQGVFCRIYCDGVNYFHVDMSAQLNIVNAAMTYGVW